MKIIDLEEYRKSKRIQGATKKQENVESAKEKLKALLKARLEKKLLKKLQEHRNKQFKTRTKEPPSKPS